MKRRIYSFPDDEKEVESLISGYRKTKKKIVFTNGCFDILHVGHLRYLEKSHSYGDILIAGLNSDRSVKKIKGPTRPVIPQMDRAELLMGLRPIDHVIIFDEETPVNLISKIQPDILVKGGDWSPEEIVGSNIVRASGGMVLSINFEDGHSTTDIIEKIAGIKPL